MQKILEKRVEFYQPLVSDIVSEFKPSKCEREDAMSAGNLGLCEAMRSYRGMWCNGAFSKFAEHCIRSSIAGYLIKDRIASDHSRLFKR